MSEEIKCRLCKIEDAVSIKSHIFTHFFIKSLINPEGIMKRGYGRSYAIGEEKGVKTYIENDVSHSDFIKLFGDTEMDEEKILEIIMDPYAKAYFLCKNCEDRMKILEDYFNDNVYRSILDEERVNGIESIQPGNNLLIRLFFYTLFWRASAAKFDNFEFGNKIEEELRILLNNTIGDSLEEIIQNANDNKDEILKYPLFLGSCREFTNTTQNQIKIENYEQPYFFEINEYSILFFKSKENLNIEADLFGIEKYIKTEFINIDEDRIKIILIETKDWDKKIKIIIERKAHRFLKNTLSRFVKAYYENHKCIPRAKLHDEFKNDLIYGEDTTLSLKYSEERIQKLINKHSK